jgi:hypothetical protein
MRIALILALGLPAAPARAFDVDLWARLLEAHTREVSDLAGVRVDYAALTRSEDWRRLVAGLADADPAVLEPGDENLAFWINVYNVLAIEMVVKHYPVASIRDIGSFLRPVWKKPVAWVGRRELSLDEVEHRILRPLGEPRIHGAIVCASLSCPPLAREPYRAGSLDAQLDASFRRWLADPRKGVRLDRGARTLHLSPIFDWFEEDFEASGGVLATVQRFAPDDVATWIAEHGDDVRIRYLDYDWSLNDLRR